MAGWARKLTVDCRTIDAKFDSCEFLVHPPQHLMELLARDGTVLLWAEAFFLSYKNIDLEHVENFYKDEKLWERLVHLLKRKNT